MTNRILRPDVTWPRLHGSRKRLAALPQDAEQHADAGGDQQRLDRLFLHVLFQALFPLLGALPALLVIVGRLVAELVVLLAGLVADLAAHVTQGLGHLTGAVLEALTARAPLVLAAGRSH